jgi:subtilisin family serine protease
MLGTEYAELCAQIAEAGSARVLVQLDVSVKPAGQLSDPQENAQEARIDDAQEQVKEDLAGTDSDVIRELATIPFMSVEVDQDGLAQLVASDVVQNVAMDGLRPTSLIQSVPLIGAPAVWNYGYTGAGQTIAILDTGIQKTHPFITAAKVVSEACYSTTDSYYGSSSFCPNGFDSQIGPGAGINCTTFFNECAHGTHVAGIAAGKGPTFSGVAPDATLISIQVFSRFINQNICGHQYDCALAWDSDILAGLERVYELQNSGAFSIAAVNLSLGGGSYTTYCDSAGIDPSGPAFKAAIDNLRSVGVATVIAAGNDGSTNRLSFPACISSAVSVGATTKSDQIASYSNRASFLSLLAPGSSIYSSVPTNSFEYYNGTSMAAPHVAGVFALLKQVSPGFTVTQMLSCLRSSGVPVGGYPRIQVANAFICLSPRPAVPTLLNPAANGWANTTSPTFDWQASANSLKYQIQFSRYANFSAEYYNWTLNPGETSLTQHLDFGTFYWRVRGINQYGLNGDWSPGRSVTIDTAPPAIPALVSPVDASISRLVPIYKWAAISDATYYQFQVDDSNAFDSLNFDSGQITATTIQPPFEALSWYYWRVRAADAAGNWSDWSLPRSVLIIAPLPAAPALSSPAAAALTNDNTPDLSWGSVAWGDTYELQIATSTAFTIGLQIFPTTSGVLNFTMPLLSDGIYYWRVRAYNVNLPAEAGAWSVARYFTVDTTPPVAPLQSKPVDNNIEITTAPRFDWAAASSANLYHLQVSDLADFSAVLVDQTTSALTYTLVPAQALDFEINYWRVQAGDAAGNWGPWSPIRQFTVSLLSSPKDATFSTDTTPLLQWLAAAGAVQYNVQVDNDSDFSSPEIDQSLNALKLQLDELPYGLHYWRMAVQTAAGWSSWMPPWSFTLSPAPPAVPALTVPAAAALINDNTPDLSWGSALNGDTYEVQISGSSTFAILLQDVTGASNITTFTANGLVDGSFYWRVRAKNVYASPGAWSVARYFTVDTTPPLAPAITAPADNLRARGTAPLHSWTAAATATQYQLQYDLDGGDFSAPVYNSGAFAGTTRTPAFSPLGSYDWRLRARDAAGNWGPWTALRSLDIILPLPAAPVQTAPAAGLVTNNITPHFSWNAVANGDTYEIQLATNAAFTLGVQTIPTGSGVLFYDAPALAEGTYYWRVRAYNANSPAEPGAWSVARYVTIDLTPPAAPVILYPVDSYVSRGTAPLHKWNATATAMLYQIQYDLDGGDFSTPVYDSGAFAGLMRTPAFSTLGSYDWRLRAQDAAGNWGAWTAVRSLEIRIPIPAVAPVQTAPVAGFITNNTMPHFTWNAVANGNTYELQLATNATFSLGLQGFSTTSGVLFFDAPALADGFYYWRVRALNANPVAEAGPWTAARYFTIDTLAPNAPLLTLPADSSPSVGTPTHTWVAASGASKYRLVYSSSVDLLNLVYTSPELTTLTHKPTFSDLGAVYWSVQAGDAAGNWGSFQAPRLLTINPPLPIAPALSSPASGFLTNDNTIPLSFGSVAYGITSRVQLASNTLFSLNVQTFDSFISGSEAAALPDGTYYWRVSANNSANQPGAWSAARYFTVDTTPPLAPAITAPADNLRARGTAPLHSWTAAATATQYQLQYDLDGGDFSAPVYNSGAFAGTTRTPAFSPLGSYDWRLRARDAAGNWGPWTALRSLDIILPLPAAPVQTAPAAGLVTNNITPHFSWNAVANGDTYEIQLATNAAFTLGVQTIPTGSGVLFYDAPALAEGTYYWRVRAYNANSPAEPGAWSVARYVTIDLTPPAAPVILYPVDSYVSRGTAPLHKWNATATAMLYQIQYDLDGGDFSTPVYDSGAFAGLMRTPAFSTLGSYDWRLRAQDAAGNWGAWTAVRSLEIRIPIPAVAPVQTAPVAGFITNNTMPHFTWNAVANGNTYELQLATNATFSLGLQGFSTTSGVLFFDAPALADGFYYWRVRALNANPVAEAGPWTAARYFTIDTLAPNAPVLTVPVAAAFSVGAPVFAWSNPGEGATQYELQIDESGEDFSASAFDSGWITTLSKLPAPFNGLGSFDWRVRARDAAGNAGPWSAIRTLTINPLLPAAPAQSSPASGFLTNDNTVPLSFGSVTYGVSYRVQLASNAIFTLNVQTLDPFVSGSETAALPDGSYYWRVSASNNINQPGAWSVARYFTVDTTAPLAPPTITVPIDNFNSRLAALHQWVALAGASHYEIQYDEDGGDFGTPLYDSGWVNGISLTSTYNTLGAVDWRMRARDAAGNIGGWTATRNLSIIAPLPAAPMLLFPGVNATTNDNSPSFIWQGVVWGNTYQIQVDNNNTFTSPEAGALLGVGVLNYTSLLLPDGVYYWRVRAYNVNSPAEPGAWSAARMFVIGNYQ